ncbi:Glyoxalase/fosfomycin resistance/dioxygenase domain-containing protein [Vibrio crassostreae]|uniref:VOC family protein n=1 Tax=Vibrio crassostreae TaxID=246167 RepID=UPI001B316A8E|nr:VOC family protein [Vibrio crassostreae]CAK2109590.1 Glyoxalase/fosfomycin resistance/dioxygenase domain-containing protein [Vibrio crassostreae]CAK2114370.1 Glyoxalase/fosfomycin resistance/dioxygenase domain-containing protein [Vibrio crassostreae]CAK2120365.1 Glyoxalase/fosfomycin resistance/dioxygenase domain-containing protein [Vibrio crassostreae]CAK2121075.1 Glyoxalase/fosfomycin resistance/dioxygenase domain-containing protein [Vibrio crassostreae]CAK2121929.1 Glyoxalase/fosfomycin 
MFSHVFLGTEDIERAKCFYDPIMKVLGYNEGSVDPKGRCVYVSQTGVLGLTKPIDGQPATHGNGMTIGFLASSPEVVDEWHRVGVENGGTSIENGPGARGSDERRLYMAYLRDPDGNKICATHFMP